MAQGEYSRRGLFLYQTEAAKIHLHIYLHFNNVLFFYFSSFHSASSLPPSVPGHPLGFISSYLVPSFFGSPLVLTHP